MKLCLVILGALTALTSAAPARADAYKEAIYVLGVHIGNANGTLFGLNNSYNQSKEAHPGAEPLLKRQLKWTKDLAEALGVKTEDLAKLDKDLPTPSFSEMQYRFDAITKRLQSDVSKKFLNNAGATFGLGVQVTKLQGILTLAFNVRPQEKQAWRSSADAAADALGTIISQNRLEVSSDLAQAIGRSATMEKMAAAATAASSKWQSEFGAAPAWSSGAGSAPSPVLKKQPSVKPLPPTVLAPKQAGKTQPKNGSRPNAKPSATAKSSGGFGGTWGSNWGEMHLSQSGSQVTGTYTFSQGSILGTVSGNVMRFHWEQKGNGHKGLGRVVMAPDGKSFTGTWGYKEETGGGSWSGSRK